MKQGSLADLFVDVMGDVDPPAPARPPATKPTIKRLNFSHEAIIRWMLENPGGSLGDCAKAFGYTQAWLSIIIHSDAFKAKYTELSAQADSLVVNDIPAKMRGVASLALEGLADQVESALADKTVAPRDFLLKTTDTLLTSLGYGQKGSLVINQNAPGAQANFVGADALERAKQKLISHRGEQARVIEGESEQLPETPAT